MNYITMTDREAEHRAIADNITDILRDIIHFQSVYIDKAVAKLDLQLVEKGKHAGVREGTSKAGIDNISYFSKVFQVINQMLFSIKAADVADRAIARLKEGKKPVIAFSSTMGSFIEDMENEHHLPVGDGDVIKVDFSAVLQKGLEGIMRYTETKIDGEPEYKEFSLNELPLDARYEYARIQEKIKTVSTGITISPIDIIVQRIREAGYTVAEVTGRKFSLKINTQTNMGIVQLRKKINTNDAFRKFNNNEVDVLLINQSGSTGASAHAIVTNKVSKEDVKQRVMIVLQAELDINTEVQKRGRINRTGQIYKPIYDYVNSAIPAEMRLMMMLQKKLKSLDANTASNQKQSTSILDVPDFLNKYGDKVVKEYLIDNPTINDLIGDPLGLKKDKKQNEEEEDYSIGSTQDAAHRVSGRIAVLSTQMQQDFYTEVTERYNDYIEYLKQVDEYDLEVETMDLKAETLKSMVVIVGKGGRSAFGDDSELETVKVNVLKKPFSRIDLAKQLEETLKGKTPQAHSEELISEFNEFSISFLEKELQETKRKYEDLLNNITQDKTIKKLSEDITAYRQKIQERKQELEASLEHELTLKEKQTHNRKVNLERLFKYFTIGKLLNYPMNSFEMGEVNYKAVFLGFSIDKRKKNPYIPSAVKLRFALGFSGKYIVIPASYTDEINGIIAASMGQPDYEIMEVLDEWQEAIKNSVRDRTTRFIVSGNLIQAFSQYRGKLVSYTTNLDQTKKGILMHESWVPDHEGVGVIVPIQAALPLFKSLTPNASLKAGEMSVFRTPNGYRIILPASTKKGGSIFLDEDILELVDGNNFEKTSDKMVAMLPANKIEEFIKVCQRKHGMTLIVSYDQYKYISKDKITDSKKKPITIPSPEDEAEAHRQKMLKLKAKALILKQRQRKRIEKL